MKAKKTQRDKDWPMIRRLVDAHFDQNRYEPTAERIRFWMCESRTPEVLIHLAAEHPELLVEILKQRPLLAQTSSSNPMILQKELDNEQAIEREADQQYWRPLVKELEGMRATRRNRDAK